MASLPIGYHLAMRPVVSALSLELPQFGGDDVERGYGRPYNGVPLYRLMLLNWTSDAELT